MLNSTEMLRLVRAACNGDHLKLAQQIDLLADSVEKAKPTAYTTNLRRLAESEREKGLAVNTNLAPVDGLTEPLLPPDGTHKPVWDKTVRGLLDGLVAEYGKLDVLTAHNLAPRNRIMLTGAPGTGKTTFASILSERLGLDGVILRADRVISSQLGKTLTNIALVFDRLHMERKLLFIDECDMLLARRDNSHDVAEMRRTTNLMLQKIDLLPEDCILICATNMDGLIDRAAWRRFDVRVRMTLPDKTTTRLIIMHRLKELNIQADVRPCDINVENISPALIVQTVDNLARKTLIFRFGNHSDRPVRQCFQLSEDGGFQPVNRDGYKFDINVRRNGFMSYLWSAEVEDEGFFTPIANGTAHTLNGGKKAAMKQARKWAQHQLAHPSEKERWAECATMSNTKTRHRRSH